VREFDLIVRGGRAILLASERSQTTEVIIADIAIADGVLAAIEPELPARARAEIDASGLYVLPAAIDVHVHCNEPGRADWEGFASASRAMAAGGVACFCDMPLNASPPTVDAEAFEQKRRAAERSSVIDFALWGGIVPGNLERLPELADCGVVGFKAFMVPSGLEDFPAVDDLELLEAMRVCAELGLPVAVHAENAAITTGLAARARRRGAVGAREYLASRPLVAELEAIERALTLAGEAGCAVHIVHVSSARGARLVAEASAAGVDASCETCPHYLLLDEDDLERIGPLAKCAPPLRAGAERAALWQALRAGQIDLIASDHSPCPPELKTTDDFFAAWGGISGCQSTLALIAGAATDGELSMTTLAELLAAAPARRFRLPGKGALLLGADADLALVRLGDAGALRSDQLLYRHPISAWCGWPLRARVERLLARGRTVFDGERIADHARGRLICPVPGTHPQPRTLERTS
jgi:allantoinase